MQQKEDNIKAKLKKTQEDNYQDLLKKLKESSPLKLNAINSREVAWATLKLPEILEGLTLAEHKSRERQKKQEFKQSLDLMIENRTKKGFRSVFNGMSD